MANDSKAHILVVSDPPAAPGYLPRLRYMCNYLVRRGFGVTLLTEEYEPLSFAHSYPIITVPIYDGTTWDWLCKSVRSLFSDWHNKAFAKKALCNQPALIGKQSFDLVLCSTFNYFPMGAAERIAEELNIPLLCDIRDLDEQVENSRYQYRHQAWWIRPFRFLYRAVNIRRRNKILRLVNAVTTVSPWHADFIRRFNQKVHIIYNGFDNAQFYPENIQTDSFRITYIGSLFDWQQQALEKVKQIVADMNEPIELDIHTPQNNPVSHDHLGDVIRRSSIMLVLTNEKTHGMLTTKFYEALGCGKPVLCVPSDKGALAELISYTHAGVATDDDEAIRSFISDRYREWQDNGFTAQPMLHREQFSRETQCNQLETIINTLIQ